MSWLRRARVTEGHSTFEQLVAPLKPILAQALVAGAVGARAGDLHAHLGWADALIRRDGRTVAPDPEASYRRAVEADRGNVYGHAMWANWMLLEELRDDARPLSTSMPHSRAGATRLLCGRFSSVRWSPVTSSASRRCACWTTCDGVANRLTPIRSSVSGAISIRAHTVSRRRAGSSKRRLRMPRSRRSAGFSHARI